MIDCWSVAYALMVIVVSYGQVFILKALFNGPVPKSMASGI